MTHILILEGNSVEMVAQGGSDALPFVKTLMALDPTVTLGVANPYAGALTADQIEQADGVVFTGAGVAWATDAPEAAPQRAAMRLVFDTGRPVWGSCNGMQLAAVVLGGSVGASPKGTEMGLARNIALTDTGQAHPMIATKPARFASPCVHRDEVQRLPDGAELLASNAHSQVQSFAYQSGAVDFWGVQYHPECSVSDMAGWLASKDDVSAALIHDLVAAETDAAAAARLGASVQELTIASRAKELSNWLTYVGGQRIERSQSLFGA